MLTEQQVNVKHEEPHAFVAIKEHSEQKSEELIGCNLLNLFICDMTNGSFSFDKCVSGTCARCQSLTVLS